jgi:hypothetical protein
MKLMCDIPVSHSAFEFNLRRYIMLYELLQFEFPPLLEVDEDGNTPLHYVARFEPGLVDTVLQIVVGPPAPLGWRIPIPGSRNQPESTRIRPSARTESFRIQHPFCYGQNAHADHKMRQKIPLLHCRNAPESDPPPNPSESRNANPGPPRC